VEIDEIYSIIEMRLTYRILGNLGVDVRISKWIVEK
jgi:hypothetical protein